MSSLLLAQFRVSPDVSQETVRSTTNVVDMTEPASVQPHTPGYNELFTDPISGGGLTGRQVSSHVVESVQYSPTTTNANEDLNSIVNRQISTSGFAAAKELTGEQGHGTLQIVEGIEPTIRDGQAFTSDYFANDNRPIVHAQNQLSPATATDEATRADANLTGMYGARRAVAGSQYAAYYSEITESS